MRFPHYEVEKPSDTRWVERIPASWDEKRLKYVSTLNDEKLGEATDPLFELKYVDIGSVDSTHGIVETEEMLFEDAPSRARRIIRDGDTIISTVRTYLKAIAYVDNPEPNTIVSTGFAVFRPDCLEPKFLADAIRDERFVSEVVARSVGVSYPACNASDIANIPVAVPPPDEQEKIANFLDAATAKIDALVAKKRELIELLEEKRRALITRCVTRGLPPDAAREAGLDLEPPMKPSGVEWLEEIPEHWKRVKLSRVASRVVVGIAEAATHAYADEGVPILRATNIRAGRIRGDVLYIEEEFARERRSKMIRAGDLVTVRTGNAGVTAQIPADLDGCQCFTMLITTLKEEQIPEYFVYYLNSDIAQSYFSLEGWGTAQVNISVPILQELQVPVPRKHEQEATVSFLDRETGRLDALANKAKEAIDLLHEYRLSLITSAVTGKIDVREVEL